MQRVEILKGLFLSAIAATALIVTGCATSTVSSNSRIEAERIAGPIVVPPDASLLADAIGVELFQRGYDVATGDRARSLLRNYRPGGKVESVKEGTPVVLVVNSSGYTAFTGVPEAAVVKLTHAGGLATISAVNWQADDDFGLNSVGLVDAARQIASRLVAGVAPGEVASEPVLPRH